METFTWMIHVPKADPLRAVDYLSMCCEYLNLCAGIGCGCLRGDPDGVLCHEYAFGTDFRVTASSGPTWLLVLVDLNSCLKLDMYYDGPMIPSEMAELASELRRRKVPLYVAGSARI